MSCREPGILGLFLFFSFLFISLLVSPKQIKSSSCLQEPFKSRMWNQSWEHRPCGLHVLLSQLGLSAVRTMGFSPMKGEILDLADCPYVILWFMWRNTYLYREICIWSLSQFLAQGTLGTSSIIRVIKVPLFSITSPFQPYLRCVIEMAFGKSQRMGSQPWE